MQRLITRKVEMLQIQDVNQEFDLKFKGEKRKSNDYNRESFFFTEKARKSKMPDDFVKNEYIRVVDQNFNSSRLGHLDDYIKVDYFQS